MPGMAEFAFSMQMRDTIAAMVQEQLDQQRPKYRYAVVQSIDRPNWKCTVRYNGETANVIVNMGTIQPNAAGQIVRIEGIGIDKFITDVIGGYSWNRHRWGTVDAYYTSGAAYVTWEGDALKSGPYGLVNNYQPKPNDTVIAIEIPNHQTMISPVIDLVNETRSRLPNWIPLNLLNGWRPYNAEYGAGNASGVYIPPSVEAGAEFPQPAFTKTKSGIVKLKGLISGGTAAAGTSIAILPPGFRPMKTGMFASQEGGTEGSVDVLPDGTIVTRNSSSAWTSLDNVSFPSNTDVPSNLWNLRTSLGAGFQDFSDTANWTQAAWWQDRDGIVWERGLVHSVAAHANSDLLYSTSPALPAPLGGKIAHRMSVQDNVMGGVYKNAAGASMILNLTGNSTNPNYLSLDGIPYVGVGSSMAFTSFPEWANGWTAYDVNAYSDPAYVKTRDGLVILRGLLKTASGLGDGSMFKLPPGFRPKERLIIGVVSNSNWARLDIAATGWVYAGAQASGVWCSIDGLNFIADGANPGGYGN